jgi:predicted peptidase
MKRLLWVLFLSLTTATVVDAADTGFIDKKYKDKDGKEIPYVVFVPHDYKGDKATPVILFLHGAGETKPAEPKKTEEKKAEAPKAKGKPKMPVEVGIGPAIKKREKTFPFITIIPQAQTFGWQFTGPNAKMALGMLEAVEKEYKTDAKRTYLSGLSMGGMGTWSIATAMPEKWAAIVPICGRGDASKADKLKDLPIWCFHGDNDTSVNVSGSRDMIEAIKKAGGSPKYTEYPGVGHNSWDKAYATDELYEWMLKQVKK